MDIKKLQKEIEKALQNYKSPDTPEELRAYDAGRLEGFSKALEIIDKVFLEAVK